MKKELVCEITEEYEVSITRACGLMELHRSYFYYKSRRDDSEVEEAIREAAVYGDGFRKIFLRLRRAGNKWNHKKVYRVYKSMSYNKRSRLRRRLPARVKSPLSQPDSPNTTWSIDFVSDSLECGRKFRVLNILDDFDRSAIAQEVAISIPATRLIRILEKVIWTMGKPKNIRCDNGPEFIAGIFQDWCKANDINLMYIQPGHPTQNSYIERFNGSYRRAVLDAYLFRTLDDVRKIGVIVILQAKKNSFCSNSQIAGSKLGLAPVVGESVVSLPHSLKRSRALLGSNSVRNKTADHKLMKQLRGGAKGVPPSSISLCRRCQEKPTNEPLAVLDRQAAV